jgi:hypothetical protein
MNRITILALLSVLGALCASGCVQRTLTVRSNPPGALVYLNDFEVGRTPITRNFVWYGTYDVELRKEGFESIKTTAQVWAPWWQWVPIDFLAEFLPLHDHHEISYKLREPAVVQVDAQELARRGLELRAKLETSERPTTQPTTRPKKKKTKK